MALERWIALVFVTVCLIYGYTAFFTMDASLAPFMRRNPVWPSTFPKILAVMGLITGLIILFGGKKTADGPKEGEIDYRRLLHYNFGQALSLLVLMVVYALALRPMGFLLSSLIFLSLGSYILGERKLHILVPVSLVAVFGIWYLVQEVLGIFLRPWPWFI
ncbi:MAG TPA: tripartite tricarboxylate transporter TctB family protein [Devosia sp.]|nr:tripartite tricarboxylate transporter TctB family protein [Devosia sp.]